MSWGKEQRREKMLYYGEYSPLEIIGAAECQHQALPWNATVSLIAAFRIITAPM